MTVVGIRFERAGRVYYFDAGDLELEIEDEVVAETEKGLELGRVAIAAKQVIYSELKGPLKPILRKASPEDLEKKVLLDIKEVDALATSKAEVAELGLPMKILDAHYTLDERRIVFYFGAEERVDFRPLLRRLGETFHKRIEMRQVGPRDEAKILGGIGRCGQVLCCTRWLSHFSNITIRMAKEQGLPVSAQNLSGQCGRLRCCLRYEYEQYVAMNAALPRIGEMVTSPYGEAKVIVGHPLKDTVSLLLESEATVEVPLKEITRHTAPP